MARPSFIFEVAITKAYLPVKTTYIFGIYLFTTKFRVSIVQAWDICYIVLYTLKHHFSTNAERMWLWVPDEVSIV